jgi:hypothetical protein
VLSDPEELATQAIKLRHQQGGLAPFGRCHRGGQLRPVTALAAVHLHEFRDLLTNVISG